ncbi:unnamed protein product [Dovyalis caffra]|uniref:Leucine-rich repeat-containing N-terminal plant-type domain-containing protein n=1 Tax=Dovyalis caffra TaxID=77055 RepID=A0AAV1RIB2_9ROSI|nr:unnamed protein product [Dovyalis caffra]
MGCLLWIRQSFLSFILFHLHFQTTSSLLFSSNFFSSQHLCSHDQSLALIQFKDSFSINTSASWEVCGHPKTKLWKEGTDCCSWDGVTCDKKTGQVIELDLACSMLYGTLHSKSPLFSLHHLQKLDLSNNHFNNSHFSSRFGQFPHLTHLNLHNTGFSGRVPSEISHLSKLVSLYLNGNLDLTLEPISLHKLVQNLTKLRELDLSGINMSLVVPNSFMNLSSSLSFLSLMNCGLQGKFPGNIFLRPNLETIYLFGNEGLIGSFRSSNESSALAYLDLSQNLIILVLSSINKLRGEISSSVCNLKSLQILDLSNNSLSGFVPQCLGNFSNSLSELNLGMNNLEGNIPSTFSEGNSLEYLNLNDNELEGNIPRSIINCTKLKVLDLGNNKIADAFPYFLEMLQELKVLVLRSNRLKGFVKGPTTKYAFSKLRIFDLSGNNFSGPLPTRYFIGLEAMMTFDEDMIYLRGTNFTGYNYSVRMTWKGLATKFSKIQSTLTSIDLSDNNFRGDLPDSIRKLKAFEQLNLSHKSLRGYIQPSLGTLTNLESLDLSSNLLSGRIPRQLADLTFLQVLNLSYNLLEGPIPEGKQFNTFDRGSFEGNLGLCGFSITKECSSGKTPPLAPSCMKGGHSTLFEEGFGWKAVAMGYGCRFVFGTTIGYIVFRTGKPAWLVRMVQGQRYQKTSRTKSARINPIL